MGFGGWRVEVLFFSAAERARTQARFAPPGSRSDHPLRGVADGAGAGGLARWRVARAFYFARWRRGAGAFYFRAGASALFRGLAQAK